MGFDGERKAPVEVGQTLQVQIESVGAKGDGMAKKDGFVIFVPQTQKGDNVTIKITKVKPTVAFAEVVQDQQTIGDAVDVGVAVEDSEDFGEEQ